MLQGLLRAFNCDAYLVIVIVVNLVLREMLCEVFIGGYREPFLSPYNSLTKMMLIIIRI